MKTNEIEMHKELGNMMVCLELHLISFAFRLLLDIYLLCIENGVVPKGTKLDVNHAKSVR